MTPNCRASVLAAPIVGRLYQTPISLNRRFTEWSRRESSDIDGKLIRARERERTSQTPYNFRFHPRKIPCDKAIVFNARLAPRAPDSLECKSISRELIPRYERDDQIHRAAIGTVEAKHKPG